MRKVWQRLDPLAAPQHFQQFRGRLTGCQVAIDMSEEVAVGDATGLIGTQNLRKR
jgi:hypothetical protein